MHAQDVVGGDRTDCLDRERDGAILFTNAPVEQLALPLVRARRRQRVHSNSREAYASEIPNLNTRALDVLAWIKFYGPCTDRECAAGMGYAHRSLVQPRITELLDRGLLEESGKTRDATTGKTVRLVRWAQR